MTHRNATTEGGDITNMFILIEGQSRMDRFMDKSLGLIKTLKNFFRGSTAGAGKSRYKDLHSIYPDPLLFSK
jgi:hypothetical protein